MRFEKAIDFAAPAEQVFRLLGDRTFREEVCRAAGATSYDVAVQATDATLDSLVESSSTAEHLPAMVRKLIGSSFRLRQEEHWTSPSEATVTVSSPGIPGTIHGRLTLAPTAEGARQVMTADIKVGVPIVGAKVEALIGSGMGHVLKVQARVAADWLSR